MEKNLESFAERNPILLKEVAKLAEREKGMQIGCSIAGTRFYSIGQIYSPTLGREIYAGLKVINDSKNVLNGYILPSIVNLITLEEICPELSGLSPRFMGALRKNGNYLGIIMEDFSEGGKVEVQEVSKYAQIDTIPREIFRALDRFDIAELTHLFCRTGDRLRMMDFNCLPWNEQYDEIASKKRSNHWGDEDFISMHSIELSVGNHRNSFI